MAGMEFEPLKRWLNLTRKSDADLARLIGVSASKLSRAKRGIHPLPMRDQIEMERFTGITPAQWAEWYAEIVKAETPAAPRAQKKSVLVPGDTP